MLSTRLLNVVVVGAGVYVCGRGTKEYGTVMPAILGWKKANALGKIYIVGQSRQGVGGARAKIKRLTEDAGVDASVTYFANGKKSGRKSYLEAFREIPKPACAIVVVPDNVHAEVASAAIKAGLHTLVVKPLTPTVGEAEGLIDLQQKSGVHCAVEFHKRLDLANIRLRDVIAEKRIGDPLYFIAEYSQRKNVPYRHFKKWVKETNVFQYLGVHYVDIIRFVTRAKPVRAMATGQKGWLASKGIPAYDSVQGVIEWKMPYGNKFLSYILTNWVDPNTTSAVSNQKIKVIGTKGRFESEQKKRGITIVTDENGIEEPNPYFCMPYGKSGEVSYRGYGIESIHQFFNDVADVENGKLKIKDLESKRPTFREAVASTAVIEAVNKSLKSRGKWIEIKNV